METEQKSMKEVELVGTFRKPHTTVEVDALPKCDICRDELGILMTAFYDARTRDGYWAYLCEDHFARVGIGLGLGKGQRLVLRKRLVPSKPE